MLRLKERHQIFNPWMVEKFCCNLKKEIVCAVLGISTFGCNFQSLSDNCLDCPQIVFLNLLVYSV